MQPIHTRKNTKLGRCPMSCAADLYKKEDYQAKNKKNPNGYIVPAKFGVHFLPRMKNVLKRTKMYSNEIGLTNTEICKSQIQLRQPPISW